MTHEFNDRPAELEVPTNEVIQKTDLVTFLNDLSTSTVTSMERPDYSKWVFKNGSDILTAILEIQKYNHEGEIISIHWTCEALQASFIRTGVYAEQISSGDSSV